MVPGMTERERLALDAQRIVWLAEAVTGPALVADSPVQRKPDVGERSLPPILQKRRPFPSVRELRQLVSLTRRRSIAPFPARTPIK